MPFFLTVRQAAKHFQKHPQTIYRWIEEGKVKARKDSGGFGWLIIVEDEGHTDG